MIRDTLRFSKGEYDLIVVGGGINGAAIANVAASNGLKAALLEKNDFASGTSSKSTKLIHGGIRYLEHLEFDLVRESLKERAIQLKSVPHLVHPLKFILPVYKNDSRFLWMIKLGVWLYDFLSGRYKIGGYSYLTKEELFLQEPSLAPQNLLGGVSFYDAQMDDARLCLENVLSAAQKGAHVANYIRVENFLKENGKVVGVKASDILTKQPLEIRGKRTVCAGGPWNNDLLKMDNRSAQDEMRLTKGIHLVYKGKISEDAFLLTSGKDRRVFFVIPWMGNSLIGTTDTDYAGDLNRIKIEAADVEYLLKESARFFPSIESKHENIITAFAGLRPLLKNSGSPSSVSRRHKIFESFSGIFFVLGGKYTTYRKIAEECVGRIAKIRSDEQYRLYGSGTIREPIEQDARQFGLPEKTVEYLREKYGTRSKDVLALTVSRPELKEAICSCSPAIAAQVVYSIEVEMAQTPEDVIDRRLGLGYLNCPLKECESMVKKFFAHNK